MATTANELARLYDRYVTALWRGESDDVRRFGVWLKGCWALGGPPQPSEPPAAISTLGGVGSNIRWYECDDMILGYIPGVLDRCYQIPRNNQSPKILAY